MTATKEPDRLKKGKAFHDKVQTDWRVERDGEVTTEKPILKPNGRRGRIDVYADSKDPSVGVGVGEVKSTDWDQMAESAVHRNVRRQAKQIWQYIESQLADGHDVSPGVIFPARPQAEVRLRLVESLFDEEGIAVVWDDETIAERKTRG